MKIHRRKFLKSTATVTVATAAAAALAGFPAILAESSSKKYATALIGTG